MKGGEDVEYEDVVCHDSEEGSNLEEEDCEDDNMSVRDAQRPRKRRRSIPI